MNELKINNHRMVYGLLFGLNFTFFLLICYAFYAFYDLLLIAGMLIFDLVFTIFISCFKMPPYGYNYKIINGRFIVTNFLRRRVYDKAVNDIISVVLMTECYMILFFEDIEIPVECGPEYSSNLIRMKDFLFEYLQSEKNGNIKHM